MSPWLLAGLGIGGFFLLRSFANREAAKVVSDIEKKLPNKIDETSPWCQPDPNSPDYPFEVILDDDPATTVSMRELLELVFVRPGRDEEIAMVVERNTRDGKMKFEYTYVDGRKNTHAWDGGELVDARVVPWSVVPGSVMMAPRAWAMYATRPRDCSGPWAFRNDELKGEVPTCRC